MRYDQIMEWRDCFFWSLIYRDYTGRWRIAVYPQERTVERDGKLVTEYRERPDPPEEWLDK